MSGEIVTTQTSKQTTAPVATAWWAQRRAWIFVMFFMALAGFSLFTAPLTSKAGTIPGGTVPPPPPTLLVGPVGEIAADGSSLTVAGVFISKTVDTRIDERVGTLKVGAWVRVEGDNPNDSVDSLVARRIKVVPPMPYIKLSGPLDVISDTMVIIDGIGLHRTLSTAIIGAPVVGDRVNARAAIESTGDLLALQVAKVDGNDGDDGDEEPGKVMLISVIQSLPLSSTVGNWVVGGLTVQVTAQTQLVERMGPLAPDAWVKIRGHVEGGVFVADRIQTTHTHLFHRLIGKLTQLTPQDVTVDGISLELNDPVSILGDPQPGDPVVVRALLRDDGTLVAVAIDARSHKPAGRPGFVVKFVGSVDALPADGLYGEWTIAGRKVTVPVGAFIDEHKGAVAVGDMVRVTALLSLNGALTAVEIQVQENEGHGGHGHEGQFTEFMAPIDGLPANNTLFGDWMVDGKTVHVAQGTLIISHDQPITVGLQVKVWGFVLDDGTIRAKQVETIVQRKPEVIHIGMITQLPSNGLIGTWTVGNRQVEVTNQTILLTKQGRNDGGGDNEGHGGEGGQKGKTFALGTIVKVFGQLQDDGSIVAKQVKLLD
jgi:hypothetical protein